uniref:Uncharacterized protein n=1 Tax=Glossina pallidipes TaxID=7398 RepID=A0A1A9ZZS4_GLOPL
MKYFFSTYSSLKDYAFHEDIILSLGISSQFYVVDSSRMAEKFDYFASTAMEIPSSYECPVIYLISKIFETLFQAGSPLLGIVKPVLSYNLLGKNILKNILQQLIACSNQKSAEIYLDIKKATKSIYTLDGFNNVFSKERLYSISTKDFQSENIEMLKKFASCKIKVRFYKK